MGADKALVELSGRPLIEYSLNILRDAGLPVSIAGSKSALGRFAPVVDDAEADRGPLGGICAALAATTARWAVFLPVDLPLLPPALIERLLDHARAVQAAAAVYSLQGREETFPAVVDRDALPALREELNNSRGSCIAGFRAAAAALQRPMAVFPVEAAVGSKTFASAKGSPADWFLNVNTPEELRHASHRLV